MNTNEEQCNNWETLPDEKEPQVFVLWLLPEGKRWIVSNRNQRESWKMYREIMGDRVIGWLPIQYPPPPKEETQAERDYEAFVRWWNHNAGSPKCESWPAYVQALKTERAWFRAELLDGYAHAGEHHVAVPKDTIQRMRDRCNETP